MNKKSFFVFLLIIFLSGCSHVAQENLTSYSSSNGLSINVVENSLSSEYYEGENVNIDLQVENLGNYEVLSDSLFITLSGFNPTSFGKSITELSLSNLNNLSPIFQSNNETLVTGIEYFTFDNLCYQNDIENPYDLKMKFISCYPYETTITSKVCFGDPKSSMNEICTVNEEKEFSNSIGPIQVTSIVENYIGNNEYRFVIDFVNSGTGEVIDKNKINDCSNLDSRSTSLLSISSVKLDGVTLLAESQSSNILNLELPKDKDSVRILNEEGSISFKIRQDQNIDYIGELQVTLSHGYKTSFDKNTIIYDIEGVSGCAE